MKYDKKEPETMDADPMRLLVSAILAFTVMLFINGFVGSMGGFPAFVAFTLVFFRIRTRAGMENGGMQQELSDRQITGRLLWKYAAGYLVLWGILRIAFLISRVTGWGNINGASAVEYVRQMWNTSLLEKWAYFFAGMIMFAFVLSLFPLAVIREKVRWIRYALHEVTLEKGNAAIDFERILAWNPDAVFLTNFTEAKPSDLYGNTYHSWSSVEAVKRHNVYKMPLVRSQLK